jgi:hypothetical protein
LRVFQTGELTRFRSAQEAAMMDTAVRLVYREIAANEYGMAIKVWSEDEELACGYDATAIKQVMDGAQVILTDARLRLPNGTTLDNRDRFKVTKRFGEILDDPPTYEILGEPRQGPSGLLIDLRLVTDGSDAAEGA